MTDRRRRRAEAGLTLIEVLVALAVVGVATGAMMIGMNVAGRDGRAQAEAVRLARTLTLAVDEAMIAQAPVALVWDADGYRFVRWSGQTGWTDAGSRLLALRHALPPGLALRRMDGAPAGSVLIQASGLGPAARFRMAGSGPGWVVDFDGFAAAAQAGAAP